MGVHVVEEVAVRLPVRVGRVDPNVLQDEHSGVPALMNECGAFVVEDGHYKAAVGPEHTARYVGRFLQPEALAEPSEALCGCCEVNPDTIRCRCVAPNHFGVR